MTNDAGISNSERQYIIEGCRENIRLDGRSNYDYRHYTLVSSGGSGTAADGTTTPSKQSSSSSSTLVMSNGSARIILPGNKTNIICSVKADLVHPSIDKPNEGIIELNVDLSSSSSSSLQQHRIRQREEMSLQTTIRKLVLNSNNLLVNYKDLCIIPGRYVWRLSIDLLIFSIDGNMIDVCIMVMKEALKQTMLPTITPIVSIDEDKQSTNPSSSSVVATTHSSSSSAMSDLLIDHDICNATSVIGNNDNNNNNDIVVVTVNVMKSMSSSSSSSSATTILLLDTNQKEEECCTCQISITINTKKKQICSIHTHGGAGGKNNNTISYNVMNNIMTLAMQKACSSSNSTDNNNNNIKQQQQQQSGATTIPTTAIFANISSSQEQYDFLQEHFQIR